jgi:hypothetical protein
LTVKVSPETFTLVTYDASEIASIVDELIEKIGLPSGLDVSVEVDESTPLGRATVASIEPLVISVESGALEDPKHPRHLSRTGSADVIGRLMFRVRDRLDESFGEPPEDDKLTLPQSVAWDAYCVGRLVRLGFRHYDNRQRRLYHFRNRHGFSDAADEAFDRLWTADGLSWADICALSDSAVGTSAA